MQNLAFNQTSNYATANIDLDCLSPPMPVFDSSCGLFTTNIVYKIHKKRVPLAQLAKV